MKKAIIILYFLITVSFIWLAYASFCNLSFNPDSSAGIIVACLCGMVTLLIGYQIYNAIDINRELRKTTLRVERINQTTQKKNTDLQVQIHENRSLINSVLKYLKVEQNRSYKDCALVYIEALSTIKFLFLSNIYAFDLEGERELLSDCYFTLDSCLTELEEEEDEVLIRLFNNYHSICDDLYSSIIKIIDNPAYKIPKFERDNIDDLNKRRKQLITQYGGIGDKEKQEILKQRRNNQSENNKG